MQLINFGLGEICTCEKHSYTGMLPCPWPKCSEGLEFDEFGLKPVAGEGVISYKRSQWQSINGEAYFTWKTFNLPHWFGAANAVHQQAEKMCLVPKISQDILYHYTSLEGFMGIIQNKSIWLTDYAYLNDSRELIHGVDLSKSVLQEIMGSYTDSLDIELLNKWKKLLDGQFDHIYVASFTTEDDSLSQWRAYGPIAIGFSVDSLCHLVSQSTLQPVVYTETDQRKIIEIFFRHNIEAHKRDATASALQTVPELYANIDRLLELLAFFKNSAFESESECRLSFIDRAKLFEEMGQKKIERKFRSARGKIIPFLSSAEILGSRNGRNKPSLNIKNIILGPECDPLLERGVQEFLNEHGLGSIEIKRSRVPFRS